MRILHTCEELAGFRAEPGPLALVPTMGALHAGHVALVSAARARCPRVITSIFVNPTQFRSAEGSAAYPRTEAEDIAKLESSGCDAAWLPAASDLYPPGDATVIEPGGPALGWEGDARPGHFRGMATVVAKLFGLVRPAVAVFGEKDWQQLQVVRRMVADLLLPVEIVPVPTVREPDGLAMSSRNRFLTAEERARAPLLYASLRQVAAGAPVEVERAGLELAGFGVDYLAVVEADTLCLAVTGRVIVAARLGRVRLLDNLAVPAPGVGKGPG